MSDVATSPPSTSPAPDVEVQIELDRRINFAMQQNDVPVVKALRVENRTDAALRDVEVRIFSEPDFAQPWSAQIAALGPHSTYNIAAVDLVLSPAYLAELTERVRGQIRVEVRSNGQVLHSGAEIVELWTKNEWCGLSSLPEILAAFVMPNHPAIEPLLTSAADLLAQWTQDPSLNGYQSRDARRVLQMSAAIYETLRKRGITYVNPPASFGREGQRVRLPDRVLEVGMATCLDLALVAAACLEQIGLHAIVVLVDGHAFTGVWLHEECFAEAASDDGLRLRKRIELSEIAVFDPTAATARRPFADAVAEARRQLADLDRFLCAIDVARARKGRIRPLPERVESGATRPAEGRDVDSGVSTSLPPDVGPIPPRPDPQPSAGTETPQTRLDRWRRKLLDLSLRNRLLNFKDSKKTLQILCPDPAELEDMLAGGTVFQVRERPADLGPADPRDPDAYWRRAREEAMAAVLREEMQAKRLRASTAGEELDRRLVEIYRAARLGLEEGGASALYMAIGFLAWYETDKASERRLAPILLLPLELHRKSILQGFSLELGDDEPRINVTLLEMLKQDKGLSIPGLDPLPADDSGIAVASILRTMRHAVRDIPRWEVIDDVRIGLFSFTKFLMWRDLAERAPDLMRNPVVDHLVNRPHERFDSGGSIPDSDRLDDYRAPHETYCPLPADSSQLAAVIAAAEGRSFVIEGPPGTGKSQTITNLIAHCLTEGKTVLFVSEKMAALNVVKKRLESVGLGRFCLELHSNKAHKMTVIGQLERALQRREAFDEAEWTRESRRVANLRRELNAYADALHRKRASGETAFQVTSRLIGLRDVPLVDLRWSPSQSIDPDRLADLRDLVARTATAAAASTSPSENEWASVHRENWTPGWEADVFTAIEVLRDRVEQLGTAAVRWATHLGIGESGWSFDLLQLMREIGAALLESSGPPIELSTRTDWDDVRAQIGAWIETGQARDGIRASIRTRFRDEIAGLDLDTLDARLRRAETSWWPLSALRRRPVVKALRGLALDGETPPRTEFAGILATARELREKQQQLDAASDEARRLLGRQWNGGEAQWEEIAGVRDWAGRLRALALRASGSDFVRAAEFRERWARLATEGRALLEPAGALGRDYSAFGAALDEFGAARARVVELLDLDSVSTWGTSETPDSLGRAGAATARWLPARTGLRPWCAWRRIRSEATRNELTALIESLEGGAIPTGQLASVFERSYAQWWLSTLYDAETVLSQFFSPQHEQRIAQFRESDTRHMELARFLIAARLNARVPHSSLASIGSSEMGILRHEIGKKRRHLPVRQLMQKIPNLLPRLKPCLLMSPISIAQYLDPRHPPFDVVVFDEASQIPVWDSIGAIARGRQAIIVGDPKQLPPTDFFQRTDGDEDDSDGSDDGNVQTLESILDECLSAQIPWHPLNWHYRSRHESLITFSNYHYYGNRLLTFPSAMMDGMGVAWRHVPGGVYDKGKSRTNRAEADAVVSEIVRRLRDPDLSKRSIGVVTFNIAQQTLIEDLLDQQRLADPKLDSHFAEGIEEPVFVKNLENVQGDERDVILFSICFGPDATGRVAMNFGPMNREGGERRLNVAVTRAKREVLVFSTLTADQIDLSRTRSRGVKDLKTFLAYAERGPSAIAEATQLDPDADFDSPFEEAVFDALVRRGWDVHKQVGCARYRIDLAVVDPEAPGRYLLGIECDGANYHRAKTARDRDKLREAVLRDLGWQLHRIWSTDWWGDPDREIQKLETALAKAQQARPAADLEPDPQPPPHAPGESGGKPAEGPDEPPAPLPEYERYRPSDVGRRLGSQADFYDAAASRKIQTRIVEVVGLEGPISLALAARRVAASWGFERVRQPALDRIRALVPQGKVHLQRASGGEFLWPADVDPNSYASFRLPMRDGLGLRSPDDLPVEEVANAVHHVVTHHLGAPDADVIREVARLFAFQRVGRLVEERIRLAIEFLVHRRRLIRSGIGLVAPPSPVGG